MPGMHGTVTAVAAMQKADLLVALGARFDDRVTGQLSTFAPDAAIVHADIDPAEISKKTAAPTVPIVGDCKEGAGRPDRGGARRGRPRPAVSPTCPPGGSSWRLAGDLPLGYDWPSDGMLSPE